MTKPNAPVTEKTALRIANALERIATATETLTIMLQVFVSEAQDEQPAHVPQRTIMTQTGPVELR